ncbi:MAG: hypothetical protein ABSA23_02855 [Anaerolineales bacterium]
MIGNAGKETHGLDSFFPGIQQRVIAGLSLFTFSLINVQEEHSYPLQVTQTVKSAEEKAASKAKAEAKKVTPALAGDARENPAEKRKPGRPKGSMNRPRQEVTLSAESIAIREQR